MEDQAIRFDNRLTELAIKVARLEEQNVTAGPVHDQFATQARAFGEWRAAADEWRRSIDARLESIEEKVDRLNRHNGNDRRSQIAIIGSTGGLAAAAVYLAQWLSTL